MNRIATTGPCLVVAFALAWVFAATAHAGGPEWGRCVAQKRGGYWDRNCQQVAERNGNLKGRYAWRPGPAPLCEAVTRGYYTDPQCSQRVPRKLKRTGGFERVPGPGFAGSGGHVALVARIRACEPNLWIVANCATENPEGPGFILEEDVLVECAASSSSGEVTGVRSVGNVNVSFTGCTSFQAPATSAGAAVGEIRVDRLKGELGYIDEAKGEVGISFTPEVSGQAFAVFTLDGLYEIEIGVGSSGFGMGQVYPGGGGNAVVSAVAPVNVMSSTFTQTFAEGADGEQTPSRLENGPLAQLEAKFGVVFLPGHGSMWSKAAQTLTEVNVVATSAEIKAGP